MNDAEYMNEAAKKYQDLSSRDESFKMYRELFEKGYDELKIGEWLLDNDPIKENKPKYFDRLLKITTDDNKIIEWKKKYYNEFIMNPSTYFLSIKQLDRYQSEYEKLLNDQDFIKKYGENIHSFTFTIYANIENLENIHYHNLKKKNYICEKKIKPKIGFLHLEWTKSPVFNCIIEVFFYLSKIDSDISLFINNNENELNEYQKDKIKNLKIFYIKDKSDDDVIDIMKKENIDILYSVYGEFDRKNVILNKPCKIMIRGIEGEYMANNNLYDYNMVNKIQYNLLKKKFNNMFYLPYYMIYSKKMEKDNNYQKIIFDKNKIKIALIAVDRKFDIQIYKLIKKVLLIKNVSLTIFNHCNKEWFLKIFDYPKNLIVTSYNNNTNDELKNYILFLDTYLYNNHSTAMEIISAYRPIIGFYNKNRFFGTCTKDIIQYLDMEKELLADNIDDYYNLVYQYITDEKIYYRMYKKFYKNLKNSNILDNEYYANQLYNKFLEIYKTHQNNSIMIQKNNFYIFYHIFCNQYTKNIIKDQITKIIWSGLYKKIDKIYCFLVGEEKYINEIKSIILNYGNKFIIKNENIGINDNTYERFTLLKIKNYILDEDFFLYIHSKGITRINLYENKIEDWKNLMEYFLIHNYKECIKYLDDGYDVLGVNYVNNPYTNKNHFSGNFWWSKGSYFKKLPTEIGKEYENNKIAYYTSPEDYICLNNPKIKILFNSNINHYESNFSMNKYIDI